MEQLYDRIGVGYTKTRRPDPRIAARIVAALGRAETVVNVGAGTGSYEPEDRPVVAVEPSLRMIEQRPAGGAPVVQASATHLPFRDGAFGAALAVLTIHHWPDRERGLRELARVARDGVVLLTWDVDSEGFWLVDDYFPEMLEIDRQNMPPIGEVRAALGPSVVVPMPIPHDCVDGFLGAYWRRPRMYLEPKIQAGISTFSKLTSLDEGLARLRADLDSGAWDARYRDLLARSELDVGYRLVIAGRLASGV